MRDNRREWGLGVTAYIFCRPLPGCHSGIKLIGHHHQVGCPDSTGCQCSTVRGYFSNGRVHSWGSLIEKPSHIIFHLLAIRYKPKWKLTILTVIDLHLLNGVDRL